MHEYLDLHAEQKPDSQFAVCRDERVTYRQAQHESNRIAGALIAEGASLGDRVAVLQKNSIETVLLFHGTSKAGLIPVPLNYRLLPADWLQICLDTEPKWFFCDAEFVPAVEEIKSRLTSVECFVTDSDQPLPGWVTYRDWLHSHSQQSPGNAAEEKSDLLLLHTSGTTGPPKVAVLTHEAVTAANAQLRAVAELQPTDRFLLALPLCHAAGIVSMIHTISCGACLVIQQDFEPATFIDAIEDENVTVTMMVPTMIRKCLDEVPDLANRVFAKLRLLIYGASPIQEATIREMTTVFGCDLAQRYGSTETLSLTWLSPDDHRAALESKPGRLQSAGRPLPGIELRIVDDDGKFLAPGNRGEIVARGPQLMRGYWNASESASAHPLPADWVATGDVGFIDSDGYLFICDRLNDVINSGGENIHPSEIEAVLSNHPDVDEVAVIGVPDAQWGERIKAIVVPESNASCSAERLIDYCRGELAGFKVPGSVDFVDSLPRNSAGKVQKVELRKQYWRGRDRKI